MAYYVILGVVPLPITPAAINIKTPSLNETVTLINDGEINIPKPRGLREISFEFMLPRHSYPFATYDLGSYTATAYTHLLANWADACMPFYFIITRTLPSGSIVDFQCIKCLIEDFDFDEDADAQGDDVMCSITLKEYRDYENIYTYTEIVNGQANGMVSMSKANRQISLGKSISVDANMSTYEKGKIAGLVTDDISVDGSSDEFDFSDFDRQALAHFRQCDAVGAANASNQAKIATEQFNQTLSEKLNNTVGSGNTSLIGKASNYLKQGVGYLKQGVDTVTGYAQKGLDTVTGYVQKGVSGTLKFCGMGEFTSELGGAVANSKFTNFASNALSTQAGSWYNALYMSTSSGSIQTTMLPLIRNGVDMGTVINTVKTTGGTSNITQSLDGGKAGLMDFLFKR